MTASRPPVLMAPAPAGGASYGSNSRDKRDGDSTLRWALLVSAALHISAAAALIVWKGMAPSARPPQYRIELLGAPGLKRQIGVVAEQQPTPAATPEPAVAPKAADALPEQKKAPPVQRPKERTLPKPVKATPNMVKEKPAPVKDVPKAAVKPAVPVAGSGDVKARGTDVTNMVVDGIDFPYPWYLKNIQRQIILQFEPPKGSTYVAEVRFVIHRDGSVTDIEVLKASGSREFDREARGSVEAVGNSLKFGPLPTGYNDDTLPVYFTFSPATTPPPEL